MTARPARFSDVGGLLVAVFGLIAFAYLTVPSVDSDYGWHVANGRHLLDGQLFAGIDTYSWTARGATWIAHEWLAEGLMAFLHDGLGPTANSILAGALGAGAVLLTVARLRGRGFGLVVALGAGVLALLDAGTIVSVRPIVVEVFAVAFLLWFIDGWRSGRIGTRTFTGVLLLEFLIWVNAHGSFVLGLGIIGAAWISLVAERDPRARSFAVIGIGAALVTLANPFGLRLYGYVASAVTGSRLGLIAEWAPPDLASSMWWAFVIAIGLAGLGAAAAVRFVLAGRSRRADGGAPPIVAAVRLDDLLIAGAMAVAGLQHGYHAGLFGIVAAPVVATGIAALLGRRPGLGGRAIRPEAARQLAPATRRHANVALLALITVVTGALVSARVGPANTDAAMRAEYPVAALPALDSLAAGWADGLCLFNDYSWGGWLEMVRPGIPVFIDGRSEVYGDAQVERYALINAAGPGAFSTLSATGANAALVRSSSGLVDVLQAHGWSVLYRDDVAVLIALVMLSGQPPVPGDAAPC
ncbi:MAG: hypothetical protein EPO00_02340 [Chloroflexota bacterium]|nr:MAG: hypothetical protein EPO00_02340 [Chloroflexota bacterium]